jgi:hypothetical protein
MLDTKLQKTGTILMHQGRIYVAGFSADNCMCREVAAHALLWGIGEMQRELAELVAVPGGTGNTAIDLPQKVERALGIEPFADDEDEA